MTAAPQLSVLDLLLEDADVSAFEALWQRARAGNLSSARLAELEHERNVALRLRERLLLHRRHQAELRLLNDTADDLAALRDLDSILEAISERARRLLDSDIAYISLKDDERGDCYVKAVAGNISGQVRGLRLPIGTGVGGMVAASGSPYFVSSYRNDTSIVRTSAVDSAVAAEGLESILGVPVAIKRDIIGVLLAGHRVVRPFSSRDIQALMMLAAHAAVAIENSRLLSAAQDAVAGLRVANATIQSHVDDLERTAEIHENLTKLVVHREGIEAVVHATSDAISGEALVIDETGEVLAATGAEPPAGDDVRAIGNESQICGETIVRDRLCAVPMTTESDGLSVMVLRACQPIGDGDLRIVERAALVASLVLVTRRRMADAEARVRGELLAELLTERIVEHDVLGHRASLLGVDLPTCCNVVVADLHEQPRERMYAAAAALARRSRGLVNLDKDALVLLLPGDDPRAVARNIAQELTQATHTPVTAAAARADTVSEIVSAHAEASQCLRAMINLGRSGETCDARDLGFIGTLFSGKPDIDTYIQSVVGPILAYDRDHRSDLVSTLDAFCSSGNHTVKTAQALHVHVNTVTQRLARVAELLGPGWREPDRLLELHIALRLIRVQ